MEGSGEGTAAAGGPSHAQDDPLIVGTQLKVSTRRATQHDETSASAYRTNRPGRTTEDVPWIVGTQLTHNIGRVTVSRRISHRSRAFADNPRFGNNP